MYICQEYLIEHAKKFYGGLQRAGGDLQFNHALRVAELTLRFWENFSVFPVSREYVIALFHDVLEDTAFDLADIEIALKPCYTAMQIRAITDGIVWLTNEYTKEKYPNLNRKARKNLELERLLKAPEYIQEIKLLDIYDNLQDIEKTGKFAKVWVSEKEQWIAALKGRREIKEMVTQRLNQIKQKIK